MHGPNGDVVVFSNMDYITHDTDTVHEHFFFNSGSGMSGNTFDDKPTMLQVMDWCRQATFEKNIIQAYVTIWCQKDTKS